MDTGLRRYDALYLCAIYQIESGMTRAGGVGISLEVDPCCRCIAMRYHRRRKIREIGRAHV